MTKAPWTIKSCFQKDWLSRNLHSHHSVTPELTPLWLSQGYRYRELALNAKGRAGSAALGTWLQEKAGLWGQTGVFRWTMACWPALQPLQGSLEPGSLTSHTLVTGTRNASTGSSVPQPGQWHHGAERMGYGWHVRKVCGSLWAASQPGCHLFHSSFYVLLSWAAAGMPSLWVMAVRWASDLGSAQSSTYETEELLKGHYHIIWKNLWKMFLNGHI